VSLPRLITSVAALLVLSLVVPALLAWRLNHARVERAERDIRTIAGALVTPAARDGNGANALSGSGTVEVLAGPGEPPRFGEGTVEPLGGARGSLRDRLPTVGATADPWGNQYTATLTARTIDVLSAGPNGVVDTKVSAETGPHEAGGDDVAVRVARVAGR